MIESKELRLLGDWAPGSASVAELPFSSAFLVNIEGPILRSPSLSYSASPKAGPSLFSVCLPEGGGIGVAVAANNHLMDFGKEGLQTTVEELANQGFLTVGAGANLSSAEEPLIFDWCSKRVGVIARCETQFGIAHTDEAGVAALGSQVFQQIRSLREAVDYLIVSVHAAAETVPWPSPQRQSLFRAMIDAGADVIHGHHSHVPQGWEQYQSGWIFYGLGNFCVDPSRWATIENGLWSLAPVLRCENDEISVTIETCCIENSNDEIVTRISTDRERQIHMQYLAKCNAPLSELDLLHGVWQEASILLYERHFADWLGFRVQLIKPIRKWLRLTAGRLCELVLLRSRRHRSQDVEGSDMRLRYHLFACESHREAITTATGVLGGALKDMRSNRSAALVAELMAET